MFTIKYSHVKSREFVQALAKLMHYPDFKETKITYNITKIGKKFESEAQICQDLFQKLVKKYALLNEKGEIAPRKESGKEIPGSYEIDPAKVTEWQKAAEDFDNTDIEIPCWKIKLSDLDGVGLSAIDLNALEPMIAEDATPGVTGPAPVTPLKAVPQQPPAMN